MSERSMSADAVDAPDRAFLRVGGLAALALGLGYIAIFALYAQVGPPPSGDGESWLEYLSGTTALWWGILGLSVLTDLLFVPVALSLYLALKGLARNAMLLATAFVGLFVALDLAVTWSSYASLLTLSANYAATSDATLRAAYIAAAHGAAAVLTSRLFIVYAIGILSFAILAIGCVMLKGVFTRTTAYLAMLTSILGIPSLTGWGVAIILNAVCATAWLLLVGYGLCGLGAGSGH
jgi:hypothetical protein